MAAQPLHTHTHTRRKQTECIARLDCIHCMLNDRNDEVKCSEADGSCSLECLLCIMNQQQITRLNARRTINHFMQRCWCPNQGMHAYHTHTDFMDCLNFLKHLKPVTRRKVGENGRKHWHQRRHHLFQTCQSICTKWLAIMIITMMTKWLT